MSEQKEKIKVEKIAKPVKMTGAGQGFERIRRITGYLVGSVERFNNSKRSEEKDRIKHA